MHGWHERAAVAYKCYIAPNWRVMFDFPSVATTHAGKSRRIRTDFYFAYIVVVAIVVLYVHVYVLMQFCVVICKWFLEVVRLQLAEGGGLTLRSRMNSKIIVS